MGKKTSVLFNLIHFKISNINSSKVDLKSAKKKLKTFKTYWHIWALCCSNFTILVYNDARSFSSKETIFKLKRSSIFLGKTRIFKKKYKKTIHCRNTKIKYFHFHKCNRKGAFINFIFLTALHQHNNYIITYHNNLKTLTFINGNWLSLPRFGSNLCLTWKKPISH